MSKPLLHCLTQPSHLLPAHAELWCQSAGTAVGGRVANMVQVVMTRHSHG